MATLSLRAKSLFALALVCVLVLLPAFAIGWYLLDRIQHYFGQAYANNLTLLSRERILAPITLDLALSRRLAGSEITRQWLLDESNQERRELFFKEAQGYRHDFDGGAYFIASLASGNYYFNDGTTPFSAAPRYTLSPEDSGDAWFYTTLRSNTPYQININTDQKLKITRVWLNTTVFDGDKAIGLTGASIDLSSFLQTFTGERKAGITPIIFDGDGVIQAHPDTNRIAFNVALGDTDASTSIFSMVEATPRSHLQAAMQRAQSAPNEVQSLALALDGRPQLVAMMYLPALDWYVLTAVDLQAASVVEPRWLWLAAASVGVLIAALLAGFGYGVERIVLRPLRRLQQSARAVADGNYAVSLPSASNDEIGDLSLAFGEMAERVREHTDELEDRVKARTIELEVANQAIMAAHKKIGDSIDYASLIQQAILPNRQLAQSLGPQHFVIWRPRDTVGGDFYVFRPHGDNYLLGLMDCAGHGVPGALMTMLARAAIDLAIQEVGAADPAAILTRTDIALRAMLADASLPIGLATNIDAALVYVDRNTETARYAGARISLYATDGDQVREYRGGRRALCDSRHQEQHENIDIPLATQLTFYLCTDGFLDQSGGEHGYGFGTRRFEAMLKEHARRPLPQQAAAFRAALAAYQGAQLQRDDITLLSFRFG